MKHNGSFITIEGISISDRVNFATGIVDALRGLGISEDNTVYVSDTYSSGFGKTIRGMLHPTIEYERAPLISKHLLNLATQEALISNTILPSVDQGCVVICNQFHDSKHIKLVHGYNVQNADNHNGHKAIDQEFPSIQPDLTFYLDSDPQQALNSNLSFESNYMFSDSVDIEFLSRIRDGFLKRTKSFPDRIKLLDASLSIENKIKLAIEYFFRLNRFGAILA